MLRQFYLAPIFILLVVFLLGPKVVSPATIDGRPIISKVVGSRTLEYIAGEISVKVNPDVDLDQVDSLLKANECYVLRNFGRTRWSLIGCDIETDVFEKIDILKSSPLIEWAEPNIILYPALTPNDEYYDTLQWPLNNTGDNIGSPFGMREGTSDADIDAPEAWDIEIGDSSLIIAVLDSGIPLDDSGKLCHPDLNDTVKFDLDIAWDCMSGPEGDRCIPADSGSIKDIFGHGTHITGILSAITNDSTGEGIAGVIWNCKIMVIKIWDTYGAADMCYEAIQKAYENGAKIINISGGSGDSAWYSRQMEDAIAEAESAGCLIVTISGNEGSNSFRFPGGFASWGTREGHENGYKNVIAVSASDYDDKHAAFSSYCESLDVTVAAPGVEVFSTLPNYDYPGKDYWYYLTTYGYGTGTSMSAPHVAGVAGLIKSKNSSLTPEQIRTIIENTADDVEDPGWDKKTGYGRVNAWRALLPYPNFYDTIWTDTTWKDSMYVIGDVVVYDTATLTIDSGTVVRFRLSDAKKMGVDTTKCELVIRGKLIVNGTENNPVTFTSQTSTPSEGDWYGIRVLDTDSASAMIEYADIKYTYCGIDYDNSASDTVSNCHFYANQMYGIKCDNSNLKILNNLIEKDTTSNYLGYGVSISGGVSPEVRNNHIKNYKYGINKTGSGSPLVRDNKITKGDVGIRGYNTSSFTIKSCCFSGKFEQSYVKNDKGTINIDSCWMEGDPNDSTPKGVWYTPPAGGTVKRSGIFNYYECGICSYYSTPNLYNGHNSIYSWLNGDSLAKAVKNVYKPPMPPIIDAQNNWWGTTNEDSLANLFDPGVIWNPYLTGEPSLYNACTGFGGAPKIVFSEPVPERFTLFQNYPNPFNPQTIIRYNLPQETKVTVKIYNILGQLVKTLVDEVQTSGLHQIVWEGENSSGQKVSSGIYFYRIQTQDFVEVKKMVFIK